jgi:hypothetical protein
VVGVLAGDARTSAAMEVQVQRDDVMQPVPLTSRGSGTVNLSRDVIKV